MSDVLFDHDEYPRDLTDIERRWIARLKRTLDAMPETLKGFHAPGSISFFERDDPCLDATFTTERQAGELGSVRSPALDRIDAGDW